MQLRRTAAPENTGSRRPSDAAEALPAEPDRPAGSRCRPARTIEYYDGTSKCTPESPWPPTTGCDQLSFNPSLTAKPTTSRRRHAVGRRRRPQSPAAAEPDDAVAVGAPHVADHAARGLLDQPQRRRRQGRLHRRRAAIGTRRRPPARSSRRSAPSSSTARRCRARSRARSTWASRSRATATGPVLTADGFATHVKLAGYVEPGPADRPADGRLRGPAAVAAAGVQHALLRLRARPAGDADAVRHLRGRRANSSPGTAASPTRPSTSFLTIDSRPGRRRLPAGPAALLPDLHAGSRRTTTAGTHAPFSLDLEPRRRRPEPDRAQRHDPARVRGDAEGHPLLPGVGDRPARHPPATRASPSRRPRPARPPARSAPRSPAPAPAPTRSTSRARSTSPAPTKARRSAWSSSCPAVSGPYDLGNVAVRAAVDVDPVTAQVTADLRPAAADPRGHPAAARARSGSTSTGPNFTLNPTNCDAVRGRRDGDRRRRRHRPRSSNHFQVANCADLPYGPKLTLKLSGGVKRRGHPAIHATFTAGAGRSQHAQGLGHPAARASSSTTPTSARSAPGPQFAADTCPAGSPIGTAEATTPLLDQPLEGQRLPALLQQRPARPRRRPRGPDRLRARGTHRHRQRRRPAHHLRNRPRRAGQLSSRSNLAGGAKGLLQNSESLCGKPKQGDGEDGRPERRRRQDARRSCRRPAGPRPGTSAIDKRKAG